MIYKVPDQINFLTFQVSGNPVMTMHKVHISPEMYHTVTKKETRNPKVIREQSASLALV